MNSEDQQRPHRRGRGHHRGRELDTHGEKELSRGGRGKAEGEHSRAKTFRRTRALSFLENMNLKRATLINQLETPELQSINPILVGELKAVDMMINEFIKAFELYEMDEPAVETNFKNGKDEEKK